jgi:hypothetical protein
VLEEARREPGPYWQLFVALVDDRLRRLAVRDP